MDICSHKTYATNFNSHAHEGRDCTARYIHRVLSDFNSHAHEGRDLINYIVKRFAKNFNSHAHEGRDVHIMVIITVISQFQLTRPRGA